MAAEFKADRRSSVVVAAGFVMVLVASCTLEALRFHSSSARLPLAPGGLLGMELGRLTLKYLGFTGGTLVLLAVLASGLSLGTGVSWLNAVERFGQALENLGLGALRFFSTWQDRKAGRVFVSAAAASQGVLFAIM